MLLQIAGMQLFSETRLGHALPFTLKFGVKITTTSFCQQLGPFEKTKPSQKIIKLFVEALPLSNYQD